jgi:hypothetical protein
MEVKRMEAKIMEVLKGMEDGDLISVWNEYCDKCNMFDDRIYYMEELDEIFSGQDVTYILNRAFYGHDQWGDNSEFNPNRNYFTFNGYGNLISLDWIGWNEYAGSFGDCIDVQAMIDYIIENNDCLYNDEIQDVLNDIED